MTDHSEQALHAMEVFERLRPVLEQHVHPLLRGHAPEVQGAVLADLVATWLAGFQGPGNDAYREKMLTLHVDTVRRLIPANEAIARAKGLL